MVSDLLQGNVQPSTPNQETMTNQELEWLSINWDNEGELFRQWILGSHQAFKLVRWMIDNYQYMKSEVVSLEDEILDCPATNYHTDKEHIK